MHVTKFIIAAYETIRLEPALYHASLSRIYLGVLNRFGFSSVILVPLAKKLNVSVWRAVNTRPILKPILPIHKHNS